MAERVVFDFTDEKVRNEMEDIFSDTFKEYFRLNKYKRKSYSVKEEDKKVTVSFVMENDKEYDCIYSKKTRGDIEKFIKNNKDINLQGCYIKDFDISEIENYKEYKLMNFEVSYSFWDGDIKFVGAQFGDGDVSFYKAQFGDGDVSFDDAQFGDGNVSFDDAQFGDGDVSFYKAQFGDGYVIFDNVQFSDGDVSFEAAQFGNGDVSFVDLQFGDGNLNFNFVQFGNGNVGFYKSQFGKGNVSFIGAQFDNGDVIFKYAKFGDGDVSFENAVVDIIVFVEVSFLEYEDLRFKKVNSLIIRDCTLEKTVKIAGIHSKFKLSLEDTANLGQIHFDDEPQVIVSAIENSFKEDKELSNKQKLDQLTLIKENYRQLGDYDGEDLAYRTYMKYKTSTKWYRWPLKFFSLVGGYGTRPLTILITMATVWFGYGVYYFLQLKDQLIPSAVRFADALYYSGITFLTIGYGDIEPVCDLARFTSISEGFIGLFLMSYLTVAVVRKLLR